MIGMSGRFARASIAFLLCLVGTAAALAQAVKDLPKPTNYVNDFSGVLSPAATAELNALCAEVDHRAHAQIAVAIVKTLNGDDTSDYAVRLEEAWKVGPKGSDRGVLILLATQDHKRWIEVGYGLEGILPDAKVGDIGRAMVPYLRGGHYDQAVSFAVNRIANIIASDAGVTLQQPSAARARPMPVRKPISFGQLIIGAIFLFLLIAFLSRAGGSGLLGFLLGMFLGGGGRGGWGGGGGGSWGGGGDGGGGGGGGGGGFGGFGGGSSGGGGAGGDW
jgi:uncharacterized protein